MGENSILGELYHYFPGQNRIQVLESIVLDWPLCNIRTCSHILSLFLSFIYLFFYFLFVFSWFVSPVSVLIAWKALESYW